MVRIRPAVEQGQRPTAALLYLKNPHTGWTKIDYLLQEAYLTMGREICSICKNPIWLCHSTNNEIDFEVKTLTCYARADLDIMEESKRDKLAPGEYRVVKPVGVDNGLGGKDPLPNRRTAYKSMPEI